MLRTKPLPLFERARRGRASRLRWWRRRKFVSAELVAAYRACAACDGFGIARNSATTFDVFFWLQVTNFDVSLLHSAPNGPDHTHIVIFVLCLHGPNYFVATFALG